MPDGRSTVRYRAGFGINAFRILRNTFATLTETRSEEVRWGRLGLFGFEAQITIDRRRHRGGRAKHHCFVIGFYFHRFNQQRRLLIDRIQLPPHINDQIADFMDRSDENILGTR